MYFFLSALDRNELNRIKPYDYEQVYKLQQTCPVDI